MWLVLEAKGQAPWFCHYRAGRWTRVPVPGSSAPQHLVWIPGTSSQWATGDVVDTDIGTAIFKYGT